MNESWDAYLAPPADFAGADDIIPNLAKERESLVTSNALPDLRLLLVLIILTYDRNMKFFFLFVFFACDFILTTR